MALSLAVAAILLPAVLATAQTAQAYTISGAVTAQGGSTFGIAGTQLVVSDSASGDLVASTATDGEGAYSLNVPGGIDDITFTPPLGSGYGTLNARSEIVGADTTLDVVLVPEGWVTFSGVLRGEGGVALSGYALELSPRASSGTTSTSSAGDGSFSFEVAPGSYSLRIAGTRYGGPSSVVPAYVDFRGEVTLNESERVDLTMPVHALTVRTLGVSGTPIAGVFFGGGFGQSAPFVGGSLAPGIPLTFAYVQEEEVSDQNGEMVLSLPDFSPLHGQDAGLLQPPGSSQLAATPLNIDNVASDRAEEVQLLSNVTFSGVLRGEGGVALSGYALALSPRAASGSTFTSSAGDGSFSFEVAPGSYALRITGLRHGGVASSAVPAYVDFHGEVTLSESERVDLTMPLHALTVRTLGVSDDPIPGVFFGGEFGQFAPLVGGSLAPGIPLTSAAVREEEVSDQNGEMVLSLPDFLPSSGQNGGLLQPPGATQLTAVSLSINHIASDQTRTVAFPASVTDTDPPSISCESPDSAWHAADVSLICTASDSGSGLANPANGSFALSTNTAEGVETANASTGTVRVCDRSDNCAPAGPITGIEVDRKPPSIAIGNPVDGATVAQGSSLIAQYVCSDGGSGVASCSGSVENGQLLNTSVVGQHTFTVNASDNVGNPATATASYTVISGRIALSSSENPSAFGAKVTFTARVNPTTTGGPTPTGTVTFQEGATVLGAATLKRGSATYSSTELGVGSHTITVLYGGDSNDAPGESAPFAQLVARASTQVTLTSSAEPAVFGSGATVKAAVRAVAPGHGTPTGTVTFSEGASTLATVALNGSGNATYRLSDLGVGQHTITATYSGSEDFSAAEPQSLIQTIVRSASKVTLSRSANPAKSGSAAFVKAVVKAVAPGSGTPTGTVTFGEGASTLAVVTLEEGIAKLPVGGLPVGEHTITATYGGDQDFTAAEPASIVQTIKP